MSNLLWVYHSVFLCAVKTPGTVRRACVNNGAALGNDTLRLQLAVCFLPFGYAFPMITQGSVAT